jgi:hypothetical protein
MTSWFAFSQDEADAANGVNEARGSFGVDLLPQTRNLDVDDVVEWRRSPRFFPDLARQHLARHEVALMAEQIFEELELARRQLEQSLTAHGASRHQIEFQVSRFQAKDFGRTTAAEQRPNPREELGQRKRLDQIVVGALIQAKDAIVDAVASGQNQDWRLQVPLPQGLQDFEPVPPRQHQIEYDQIEHFSVRAKKPVLARYGDDNVVMLCLQGRLEHLSQFPLIFDDQNAHDSEMVTGGRQG